MSAFLNRIRTGNPCRFVAAELLRSGTAETFAAHPLLDPSGLPTIQLTGSLRSGQSPIRSVCVLLRWKNYRASEKRSQ